MGQRVGGFTDARQPDDNGGKHTAAITTIAPELDVQPDAEGDAQVFVREDANDGDVEC